MEQIIAVMADREQMYQVVFQEHQTVQFMLAVAVAVEIIVDHLTLQQLEQVGLAVGAQVALGQVIMEMQELQTLVVEVEVVLVEIIPLMVVQAEQVVQEL